MSICTRSLSSVQTPASFAYVTEALARAVLGKIVIHIETERLVLRTPEEADLRAYLAYRNEPAALAEQRMLACGEKEARTFLQAQAELPEEATGWRMLGIREKEKVDNGIIGEVGVFLKPDLSEGNVGWWLHSRKRGQGIATEAAGALLNWCFTVRRLHRVTSGCLADNAASFRVMMRLGMRLETRSTGSRKLGEEWYDEIGCALLCREWAKALTS